MSLIIMSIMDVQIRVNILTHTEKIEFLAGQSEVWRSKFLASSGRTCSMESKSYSKEQFTSIIK